MSIFHLVQLIPPLQFSLYGSIPGPRLLTPAEYRAQLVESLSRADLAGFEGTLLHYDFDAFEPWVVAGMLGNLTTKLVPLIASQPLSAPPHTVARAAATYSTLHNRRVDLNLVSGARPNELAALGDSLSHDERYERLAAYADLIRRFSRGETVTSHDAFYSYDEVSIGPTASADFEPKLFVAGSSPKGLEVARRVADVIVTHPAPWDDIDRGFFQVIQAAGAPASNVPEIGLRVGIITRPNRDDAWDTAVQRFPRDRRGEILTRAKEHADSSWIRNLARHALKTETFEDVFWLGAFKSGLSNAPYVVGDYESVHGFLSRYHDRGVTHLLLDGPFHAVDYEHISILFGERPPPGIGNEHTVGEGRP